MHNPSVELDTLALPTRLRGLFNRLEPHRPGEQQLEVFMEEAFSALKADLRLAGVMVYAERRDGFELRKRLGEPVAVLADPLSATCASLTPVLKHRVYIFDDPGEDGAPWDHDVLPRGPSAGVVIGRRPHRHILFFLLDEGWIREHVDLALNVLRAAFGLQLLEERVQINLRQAAEIQESLLRETPPSFPGYEIACRSIPAEEVGHQPPLLFQEDGVQELRMGGTVIGPLPEVYFRRGFVRLEPGNVLVLFTDGIVERQGTGSDFFGEERLKFLIEANRGASALELLNLVFDAALDHGERRPWDDDVTAMVIRRPGG